MQVGITSRGELEARLKDQPQEWSQVIALRSALRVFPLVIDPKNWKDPSKRPEFGLAALRALAVSLAATQIPTDKKVKRAAADAADAADDAANADAAYAAAYSAACAAADTATSAASAAAYAAAYAAAADIALWDLVSLDCEALEDGTDPGTLVRTSLWPKGPPDWWNDAWDEARKWLSGSGLHFELWREWYFGRVEGLAHAFADFDEKADERFYRWIVEKVDKWWLNDPSNINANIMGAVDGLRNQAPSSSSLVEPDDQETIDEADEHPKKSAQTPDSTPSSEPKKKIIDAMRSHEDAPAVKDQLGRQPFAKVLASRLSEHRLDKEGKRKPHEGSFFLHIDGEWGSGKSSVLNMIRAELNPRFKRKLELTNFLEEERANPTLTHEQMWWKEKDLQRSSKPSPEDPWIVVDFNAWREQRNKPAWWAMMTQLYLTGRRAVSWPRKIALFTLWNLWRLRYNIAPLLMLGGIIIFSLSNLISSELNFFGRNLSIDFKALGQILGVLTVIGGVWQQLLIGSGQRSQKIEELRSDPYGPVMRLFDRMIKIIDRPVLVMIDDLDRCEETYVVSLLESIQTMLRDAPISYLIAGDKRWIISSFEARYLTFSDAMADPGRGLGHLFVDKLFQLSAPLPAVQTHDLESFWSGLLMEELEDDAGGERAGQSEATESASRRAEARIAEAREQARKELRGIVDQLEIQSKIDAAADAGDTVMERAFSAEAAIQISSPESARKLEHRYRPYVVLTEPNPRSLKKLVNFLALQQAMVYLEGRKVQPDLLARWCIVQMRWPQFATELASNPHWLDKRVIDKAILGEADNGENRDDQNAAQRFELSGGPLSGSDQTLPLKWANLLRSKEMTNVLTHRVVEGEAHVPLDHKSLAQMLQPVKK